MYIKLGVVLGIILGSITGLILSFINCSDPADAAAVEENAAADEVGTDIINYLKEKEKAKAKAKEERLVYTTKSLSDGGGCAICLDEYGVGERRATIDTCGHRFHAPCIEAWLRNNSTCPLCRHLLV